MLERNLAFKDKFVEKLIQETPGLCSDDPVVFPDMDTPVQFVMEISQAEFTRLFSAVLAGADLLYPNDAHETVWILQRQVDCPVNLCDILIPCLEPLFDAISTQVTNVQNSVNQVIETLEENALQPPAPITNDIEDEICGGASAVIREMNRQNEKVYTDIENSFIDNVFEVIPAIIEAIPAIGELPVDEIFDLANWYFENQADDYEADYAAIEAQMICDLKCFVQANGNTFTYQVWQEWLEYTGTAYPGNRAASVFSRFTEVSLTWINKLAQVIFNQPTLQDYFNTLYQQYFAGTQNPVSCAACECPVLCEFEPLASADPWVAPFGQDSGIAVVMGQTYTINASGTWNGGAGTFTAEGQPDTYNPAAIDPDARIYSLLVKVGASGEWFGGDELFNYEAPASGNLFFAMNDVEGAYTDNSGNLCVNVELAE